MHYFLVQFSLKSFDIDFIEHIIYYGMLTCARVCKCDMIYMLHAYACGRLVTYLCVCAALSGWVGKCMHGNVILSVAPHIRSEVWMLCCTHSPV